MSIALFRRSAVAAAVATVAVAGVASATTACSGGLTTDGMTQCIEYNVGSGNPVGGPATEAEDLFGDSMDWFKLGSQLDSGSGTDTISFGAFEAVFSLDGAFGSATLGDWSVNFWPAVPVEIAFVLKAGNGYATYLMDQVVGSFAGEWSTALLTNKKGTPQGISNISVWAKSGAYVPLDPLDAPAPAPVPLPAAAWLLLGGLGGLAGLRRLTR